MHLLKNYHCSSPKKTTTWLLTWWSIFACFWTLYMTGMLQYILVKIWLFSLIIMFAIFIQVFVCSCSTHMFTFIYYAICEWNMLFLLIPSTVDGHFSGFQVWVPVKNISAKILIYFFCCKCEDISVGYVPRSRNAISFGRHLFRFVDNYS